MAPRLVIPLTWSLLAGLPSCVAAQGTGLGWSLTSELSAVVSEGNAESLTLGMGAQIGYAWSLTTLEIEGNSVTTESSKTTRMAVGTSDDFVVSEETIRETTAEAFNVNMRLDRQVSDAAFTFAGLDWLRNTFAGVDGRFLMAFGGGSALIDQQDVRLKVDLAGTYTFQSDVVENPFVKRNFPGLRSGLLFWKRISSSTETELVTDWNVQDTEDLRLDWTSSLSVSVNCLVALKAGPPAPLAQSALAHECQPLRARRHASRRRGLRAAGEARPVFQAGVGSCAVRRVSDSDHPRREP